MVLPLLRIGLAPSYFVAVAKIVHCDALRTAVSCSVSDIVSFGKMGLCVVNGHTRLYRYMHKLYSVIVLSAAPLCACQELVGTLRGFDDYVNMVLDDVTEYELDADGTKRKVQLEQVCAMYQKDMTSSKYSTLFLSCAE